MYLLFYLAIASRFFGNVRAATAIRTRPRPTAGYGVGPSSQSGAEHSHCCLPRNALEEAVPGEKRVF